ncbi:hypothetical protein PFICI_11268 [Pestalotiopsis fici W106-1]|uniref:Uncharacterized protein n=1 Tax=Pestalotiopsis fici (strain W106-1 / CGMCC3.15140) TaxID=1229662 RepID=W3WUC0_PESFW|nr:uncharacterized protein PFICI_11268 [Pestalotiopsis fici W106-1]ETS77394.1 hypothetical protein PFICI_11268 [Pestalotiopsis fici W106-1]
MRLSTYFPLLQLAAISDGRVTAPRPRLQARDIPGAVPANGIQARQFDCTGLINAEAITSIYAQLPPKTALAFMSGSVVGTVSGFGARGVCKMVIGGQDSAEERCTGLGQGIGSLIFLITGGVLIWASRPRVATVVQDFAGAELPRRASRDEGFATVMRDLLLQRGLEFDNVNAAPLQARDSVQGQTIEILGLRDPETGIAMDHIHHIRDDGRSWARMTPSVGPGSAIAAKRHLGPGFKISYKYSKFNEKSTMKFEEADLQAVGQTFGADWEKRVNEHDDFSRYFGQAKFGDDYTLRFEIIPEEDQYNDDYEKVEQCGIWD